MCEGFIQLHRKLLDWEWYSDTNVCRLYTHCLLKANFQDKKWRGTLVKRGEFITSLPILANETGLSLKNVRTALTKLKSTGELAGNSTNKYTVISITNYDQYQTDGRQNGRQEAGKGQASGRQRATTNKRNKENKRNNLKEIEEKKVNQKKEEKEKNDFETFWSTYGRIGNKQQAIKSYERAIKGGVSYDQIIEGLEKYQAQCRANGTEHRFIKHASTWLNNYGWEDEYPIYQHPEPQRRPTAHENFTTGIALALAEFDQQQ